MLKVTPTLQLPPQKDNERYKQVKISVDTEIADSFKKACTASGVSMASKLSEFMAEYSHTVFEKEKRLPNYSTKRQRRAAIRKMIGQLEQIKKSEEQYRDRIPENLQSSTVFDSAEEFIANIDTAMDALGSI